MNVKRIGVISDTHGLLRSEAKLALAGSDLIIHAGDIGDPKILEELGNIAQVVAVKGNNDRGEWAAKLPVTEMIEFDGVSIYVLHDLHQLEIDPKVAGVRIVISGHSHRPSELRKNEIIYLNPGSAGPKRFKLPVTVVMLKKQGERIEVEFKELVTE